MEKDRYRADQWTRQWVAGPRRTVCSSITGHRRRGALRAKVILRTERWYDDTTARAIVTRGTSGGIYRAVVGTVGPRRTAHCNVRLHRTIIRFRTLGTDTYKHKLVENVFDRSKNRDRY